MWHPPAGCSPAFASYTASGTFAAAPVRQIDMAVIVQIGNNANPANESNVKCKIEDKKLTEEAGLCNNTMPPIMVPIHETIDIPSSHA